MMERERSVAWKSSLEGSIKASFEWEREGGFTERVMAKKNEPEEDEGQMYGLLVDYI